MLSIRVAEVNTSIVRPTNIPQIMTDFAASIAEESGSSFRREHGLPKNSWQYILDRVVNPSFLWSSYAPGSLRLEDYEDVKYIWQAWDEGVYIKDVGHKPGLRLIDARRGNRESQETHKVSWGCTLLFFRPTFTLHGRFSSPRIEGFYSF